MKKKEFVLKKVWITAQKDLGSREKIKGYIYCQFFIIQS
jgi:hypothetical protein